jgi:hypothetical protein
MSFIFSNEVRAGLIKVGWTPDRNVSTSSLEKAVLAADYSWFEKASQFLSSFSGLYISSTWLNVPHSINFDVERAIRLVDPLWVSQDYAPRIGKERFCPIGLAYSEHLLLFMSDDGCVYGGFDDSLLYIAPCGEEAIENILYTKNLIEIN